MKKIIFISERYICINYLHTQTYAHNKVIILQINFNPPTCGSDKSPYSGRRAILKYMKYTKYELLLQ